MEDLTVGALIHLANLLILGSFLVGDILWLRVLSILGGLCFVGYFALAVPEPMLAPIAWNTLFGLINGAQVVRLLAERRPVRLDPRQARIRALAFRSLPPREFLELLAVGRIRAVDDPTLIEAGAQPAELMLLCDGVAEVRIDGRCVAELGPGRFVGEMSWLTGDPPTAAVVGRGRVEVVAWEREALRAFLQAHPNVRAALQHALGADLASKLRRG